MVHMFDLSMYMRQHEKTVEAYRCKYANWDSQLNLDGIVDCENYAGVLFLLKEAYSKDDAPGEWNLAGHLAKYGPWRMWNHVATWTYGLLNTTESDIAPFSTLDWETANANLRKIAVVNLKKVNGRSVSSHDDLQMYVQDNMELLHDEIVCTQPRIIVCGGTFCFLKEIFGIHDLPYHDQWYYWLDLGGEEKVLVLDYFHPAVRYPKLPIYYGLVNIYQQALRNR